MKVNDGTIGTNLRGVINDQMADSQVQMKPMMNKLNSLKSEPNKIEDMRQIAYTAFTTMGKNVNQVA